jgi:hypothetical protein
MTWARQVARLGEGAYRVLVGKLEAKNHLDDLEV